MEHAEFQVMIVDDHPLMRRGIRQLLELDDRFRVIAEASNGTEAIAMAVQRHPDLILLDLNMKGMSGLDTLYALRNEGINARILILTVSAIPTDIYALVDAGADGYLLKDSEPDELLEHILQSTKGENVFSKAVSQFLLQREDNTHAFATLTERELDVLQEIARGLSNKQIAEILYIAEDTVKVHIRNLLRKLKVHSRVAATVLWFENRRV
ncbi:response regulator [Enterobacteriaceae bacterium LUAb1]